MNPVRVKICGITSERDALAAIEAGADALGFNTWKGSKRYLDLSRAAPWISALPPLVTRVAVTVNEPSKRLRDLAGEPWVDLLQLHGDESAEVCADLKTSGIRFIKAIGVRDAASLESARHFHTSNLLVDAYAPGVFGGTGRVLDWSLVADFMAENPELRAVLSGGLTPDNVGQAVRQVRPYAVDVASGVEDSPGRKSAGRMRDFIAAVRFAK